MRWIGVLLLMGGCAHSPCVMREPRVLGPESVTYPVGTVISGHYTAHDRIYDQTVHLHNNTADEVVEVSFRVACPDRPPYYLRVPVKAEPYRNFSVRIHACAPFTVVGARSLSAADKSYNASCHFFKGN